MERRDFVKKSSLALSGVSALASLPALAAPVAEAMGTDVQKKKPVIRIGICTDVHKDVIHDADQRLQAFIDEMNILKPDFIIQVGDFCRPYDYNRPFMTIWDSFKGPKYHVLGNHDVDGGFSFEQVTAFWKAQGTYYSFDRNGYHFVVLNGNEKKPDGQTKGYPRYITENQREWLAKDLESTSLPVIVYCHQALDVDVMNGIEEATLTRLIFERANQKAGFTKVRMVFSGHHHKDFYNVINGIHYVQINSMSYYWLGDKYKHVRFSEEVNKTHEHLKYTAPYKDPLWAFLTVYENGLFELKGRKTTYIGPSPAELGMKEFEKIYPVVPYISDRSIKVS